MLRDGALVISILAAVTAASWPSSSVVAMSPTATETNDRVFDQAWNALRRNFYDAEAVGDRWSQSRARFRTDALAAVDEVELYGVLNTMLRTLDDAHTLAVSPFNVALSGDVAPNGPPVGLGLNVAPRQDGWHVTEIGPGGPGEAAGLTIGEVIMEVNGRPFDGLMAPQLFEPMALKVRDIDGTITTRRLVPQPRTGSINRSARRLANNILYLSFFSFDRGTADWVRDQIDAFPTSSSLVLDLRGNTGGSLREAVRTISLFVDQPFAVGRMTSRVSRHEEGCNRALETRPGPMRFSGPMVVLIDRYSFSSAEVLASVLQSAGRAEIVGEPSGGEVTCMNRIALPDGGELRVSVAAFVTPDGRSLSETGVLPDVAITALPSQRRAGSDRTLAEAVRILTVPGPGERSRAQ